MCVAELLNCLISGEMKHRCKIVECRRMAVGRDKANKQTHMIEHHIL